MVDLCTCTYVHRGVYIEKLHTLASLREKSFASTIFREFIFRMHLAAKWPQILPPKYNYTSVVALNIKKIATKFSPSGIK